MKIFIINENKEFAEIDRKDIKRAVKTVLSENGKKITDPYEISILFTDKDSICDMNRDYRNINRATDVISFVFSEGAGAQYAPFLLGDLAICPEIVKKHSEKYGTKFETELIFVIIHGVLHLLGFDHTHKNKRTSMREMEDIIMKKLVNNWNGRCEN